MTRTTSTTANQTSKPAFPAANLILEPGSYEFCKLTRQTHFGTLHDALLEKDNHKRIWTIYSSGSPADITLDKGMIKLRVIKLPEA